MVQIRDLLAPLLNGEAIDIRAHVRKAPVVPDTIDALDVLDVLRKAETPMALVHDEYGHFEGIVTPADILDAIAGSFRSDEGQAEPEAVRRADGSRLLAGWMPVDEMADQLGVTLPEGRNYETVAGLVIDELSHLPDLGEVFETLGWRFEVVDLDGRRVDNVLASKIRVGARSKVFLLFSVSQRFRRRLISDLSGDLVVPVKEFAGCAKGTNKLGASQAAAYRLVRIFREEGTVSSLVDRARGGKERSSHP